MTRAEIKICGIKSIEDVKKINDFKIGYAGFVFAQSKRKVSPQQAYKIKEVLKSGIKSVGVFADMDVEQIVEIADFTGIDVVQLHSDEDNEMCCQIKEKLNVEIWKSISVADENSLNIAERYSHVDGFLLDTYSKSQRGGTGKSFIWSAAENFSQKYFTILAGGISYLNINEAYDIVKPQVIDVSSSVETDGKKDYKKIEQLIRRFYYNE